MYRVPTFTGPPALQITLPIPPFPPRSHPVLAPALSFNPNLRFLASHIAQLRPLPPNYHIKLSTLRVEWDQCVTTGFLEDFCCVPEFTHLSNDTVETVLRVAEKREGTDRLVAEAEWWVDRTVYVEKYDVQGQPYMVPFKPDQRRMGAVGAIDGLHVEMRLSAEQSIREARQAMDDSERVVEGEEDSNLSDNDQQQTFAFQRDSFEFPISGRSAVPKLREGVGSIGPDHSGSFDSNAMTEPDPTIERYAAVDPQHVRDDFRNRVWNAAASTSLGDTISSGQTTERSLHQSLMVRRGQNVPINLGTGLMDIRKEAERDLMYSPQTTVYESENRKDFVNSEPLNVDEDDINTYQQQQRLSDYMDASERIAMNWQQSNHYKSESDTHFSAGHEEEHEIRVADPVAMEEGDVALDDEPQYLYPNPMPLSTQSHDPMPTEQSTPASKLAPWEVLTQYLQEMGMMPPAFPMLEEEEDGGVTLSGH